MLKYIITLSLLFSGVVSFSQGYTRMKNTAEVKEKLAQATASQNTITCDFIQEKHLEYLSTVLESSGKFWFKKPSRLRWEYTDPYKYLIVLNNGKITIKDDGKKNEFDLNSNAAFQELNDLIVNSVNGTLVESDKYDLEFWENKDTWLVKLNPKNAEIKNILSRMEMYFSKSDLSVSKIKMVESDQDYTVITLTNKKFNTPVAESTFQIK